MMPTTQTSDAPFPLADSWVRGILRCPVTRSELVDAYAPDGTPELRATAADEQGVRRAYPVRDGIPVLLADEARVVGPDEA